jgi:hypothetical protein
MRPFDAYCTQPFWEYFMGPGKRQELVEAHADKDFSILHDLKFFLLNHAKLWINSSPEDFSKFLLDCPTADPVVHILRNMFLSQPNSMKVSLEALQSFLSSPSVRKMTFGLPASATPQEYPAFTEKNALSKWKKSYSKEHKRVVHAQTTDSEQLGDWNEVAELKHSADTLIICDNYILADGLGNLNSILYMFLRGRKSSQTIQISIFFHVLPERVSADLNELYQKLAEKISQTNSRIQVRLLLVHMESTRDNHDRHIYTNFHAFNSGNSFNFFRYDRAIQQNITKLSTITDFRVIPLTANNQQNCNADYYQTHLNELKQIAIRAQARESCFGDFENRLLGL